MSNEQDDNKLNANGKRDNNDDWKQKLRDELKPENMEKRVQKFKNGKYKFSFWYFLLVIVVLAILNFMFLKTPDEVIEFSTFKEKVETGDIKRVKITPSYYYGMTYTSREYATQMVDTLTQRLSGNTASSEQGSVFKTVPINDPTFVPLLESMDVEFYAEQEKRNYFVEILLSWVVPLLFLFFIWRMIFKKMGNMGGGSNVMSFGQNNSKIVAEEDLHTRFKDVAGCEESKDELVEVVDFLKTPDKYTAIGGKIPKGVLLVGPPGTGKTLMARAVAGEAGVTFFRMSGADFVEMFVGVGAARVRDLFKQAREKAPCIIFIDELDAIGKSRAGAMSTNDEREQTLNQLLVEMDGFDSTSGVIILAATNRPEVLDPALLRPGRFDRQVLVDKPDLLGREAILKIHSAGVTLDPEVNLKNVAKSTPGFVGADLANIINEAALLAVRGGRKSVSPHDLDEAIEKTIAGLEKKNRLINPREREIVAYHETGHALVAAFTPDADPVQKISIVPRGMGALGYTLQTPTEDRFLMTQDELIGRIDILLGGRAAEEIVFKKISTGASNDIMKSTDIARNMITEYGMSERFKNMALTKRNGGYLEGGGSQKEYSEQTQQYIDEEISKLMDQRYKVVVNLLTKHRDLLEKVTDHLMEEEVITTEEFLEIIKADENGVTELELRKKRDMKVTERAATTGQKRNDAIIARNKARELAESNEPPQVNPDHKTESPFTREVPLSMEGEDQKEIPDDKS
ncbi:ATP-dependent metallopeptidase FtsH/Yme1/Tma family protein [Oceanispirochaeta crateris]|uniref:ATP-dependent zinc metalloprotease FtsH n=1 Tax=Oceanispirochaeta crateris TaxID=2518645 RepID=A0A5C1QIQ6_9SPIO|nr:ATP-dependent zinc metalloprotease FtsH [Oceanispirochaeta crateris]QEN07039.1 ATP-dependent metallopeptidase FtsH/Yme1/Tma family protein [Oceanispirochaeta crateris]